MAIEVFKRKEIKYLLDKERYDHIRNFLETYMNLDEFCQGGNYYTIANIYYDTPDSDIIRQSVAKPKYKEKLRLRAYGVPELTGSKTYLEIKKKYRGIVYKRRITLDLQQAYDFIENPDVIPEIKKPKFVKQQVCKELQHTIKFYKPIPMIYLAYDRIAYFGKPVEEGGPGRDLRISFDFGTRTRRENVRLEAGDHGEPLLPDGRVIMEVKSAEMLPRWLLDYFKEYDMKRGSFSKYGTEYKRFLRRNIDSGREKHPSICDDVAAKKA